MKKKGICPLILIVILLTIIYSCKKDEKMIKKDPIITWANPVDIDDETLLSGNQLYATADVSGTFVYTPALGTKLNEGANQDLKVDFIPTDTTTFNIVSKTVKINVIYSTTVTDIDGNVYNKVKIGSQTWMVENLKTTKYNDGTVIPNVTDNAAWSGLTTSAYCWYNNDAVTNKNTYGALYNWYTVNTGKLCPIGWHVPSDAEWKQLTNYLGGVNIAGGKLKEIGTIHWSNPNTGATNESCFTALPGGWRLSDGKFMSIRIFGYWWEASNGNTSQVGNRYLYYGYSGIYESTHNKEVGFSVRCMRD